jgi:molybdopterin molybdotransferase
MALLPVEDALARLLDGAGPVGTETLPLRATAGRVLAADLTALRTQPPFDASAMDGYAARSEDIASVPVVLDVIGAAPAGRRFAGDVGPGQAVRIFTGAPMPPGADTIVIQENTEALDGTKVRVTQSVAAGRHIRRHGLDFSEGDRLLVAGRVIDAAAVSLAASGNHRELDVLARPLVAILATGDELVAPGEARGPDQIVASNAYGVAAIAEACGAAVLDLGIAPDDRTEIAARLAQAEAAGADVVVTLGGASVGDHDFIHDILVDQGVGLDFWKIAMRPGKPLMFGRKGKARYLGLPGNPVASLVCSHVFLKPLLENLSGRPQVQQWREATLGTAMGANDLRQDYIRAVVRETDAGPVATAFSIQDSSMLRLLSDANALILREPFAPAAEIGAPCRVLMLR